MLEELEELLLEELEELLLEELLLEERGEVTVFPAELGSALSVWQHPPNMPLAKIPRLVGVS